MTTATNVNSAPSLGILRRKRSVSQSIGRITHDINAAVINRRQRAGALQGADLTCSGRIGFPPHHTALWESLYPDPEYLFWACMEGGSGKIKTICGQKTFKL